MRVATSKKSNIAKSPGQAKVIKGIEVDFVVPFFNPTGQQEH
jgi:hypothetical protein